MKTTYFKHDVHLYVLTAEIMPVHTHEFRSTLELF